MHTITINSTRTFNLAEGDTEESLLLRFSLDFFVLRSLDLQSIRTKTRIFWMICFAWLQEAIICFTDPIRFFCHPIFGGTSCFWLFLVARPRRVIEPRRRGRDRERGQELSTLSFVALSFIVFYLIRSLKCGPRFKFILSSSFRAIFTNTFACVNGRKKCCPQKETHSTSWHSTFVWLHISIICYIFTWQIDDKRHELFELRVFLATLVFLFR